MFMDIDIDEIVVSDRIRRDFGDIKELAEDIKQNGLINPPTINKDHVLLAGERRLRACKSLGWKQITVHVLDTKDEARGLAVEMSENNLRRNFTGSELAEGIRRQMAIEAEKAKERQQATQFGSDGGANIGTTAGKSRDKAAEQFGISGEQARKTLYVDDHRDLLDPADFAEWDEGKLSTNKAFQRIKAAMAQAEKERDEARKDAEEVSELYGKVIVQRDQAESERKRVERELRKASITQTNLEMEAESLKQQLSQRPEPEVIERTVEVEVESPESKRRIAELERENKQLNDEYQQMWRKKRDLDKKLDQANELLGEKDRTHNASRDIEMLTVATNNYLRQYGGKAWAFDQFYRVDEIAQGEFERAITSLAAFATNLAGMIQDKKQLGASHE